MKTIDVGQASSPLADYVKQAQAEPLVVMDRGSPAIVLLSLANMDLETIALSMNPEFLALIERARTRSETEGGFSPDEMRRRVLAMPE